MRLIYLLDDTPFYVHDEAEDLSEAIIRDGDYFEREILDYLSGHHPQHEIILDVGANIGNHTCYFAQYLEYYNIIAFEPVPQNYEVLRQNTLKYPNIFTRNEAVGDVRKKVKIRINERNMGACEIREDGELVVQQVRIDDLLVRERVTLIKIDVEWYEPQVLLGAKNIIYEDKPLILLEDSEERYFGLMVDMGYEVEVSWPKHKTYLWRPKSA